MLLQGWWKAYRLSDSEKIGYIPSNYVVAQGPADMAAQNGSAEGAAGAGAGAAAVSSSATAAAASSLSVAAAAAATAQQLEEIGIALHDLAAKDPKCLALKRDERFTILDKAVGGGWWRCTSLTSGETGLVPSNFLRTEMGVRRAAPALPAPRGSVPNLATLFVEGTYDFAAKKSSQLSYKKYDTLVVLKKDGSWWKARNRLGKEGVIPFNYVKEVSPASFTACFDFNATRPDELSIVRDEVLTALDLEQPVSQHKIEFCSAAGAAKEQRSAVPVQNCSYGHWTHRRGCCWSQLAMAHCHSCNLLFFFFLFFFSFPF
jgi:hypothetical protein